MRCHILEVRFPLFIPGNTIPVVYDAQIGFTVLAATGYRNIAGIGINTVFNEFRHRLQRIRLRQSNDIDRIPVIADP